MRSKRKRLAAIDVGTNSFHLIVVEFDRRCRKFKILDREKEMVRLGSSGMKRLTSGAMKRGVKTLKKFKSIADSFDAPVRAIATSAVREASNGKRFIERVKKETGIKIEAVTGKEEARLIYNGVLSALPLRDKKILLIDIGGGSTEFLIGHRGKALYSASLKLGAVRLTRIFFPKGKADFEAIQKCKAHIDKLLRPVCARFRKDNIACVVGTSGTIFNMARMIRLRREGGKRSNKVSFDFFYDGLFEIVGEILAAKDVDQRAGIEGLDAGRVDIITAGALILREIFKMFEIKEMAVSRGALREGVVIDTVEKGLL
jgi:exopolyphosphatase/guanosine-5'-triphosphate,3'-diphosphate pyrophosphatase